MVFTVTSTIPRDGKSPGPKYESIDGQTEVPHVPMDGGEHCGGQRREAGAEQTHHQGRRHRDHCHAHHGGGHDPPHHIWIELGARQDVEDECRPERPVGDGGERRGA